MKKKIFLLGAIIVLMLSISVSVSAEELLWLDCTGMEDVRNDSAWNDGYNTDFGYYEVVGEKIHMYGTMGSAGEKTTKSMKIPFGTSVTGETLIFYDVMFPSDAEDCQAPVGMQYFLGSNRATSWLYPSSFTPGEWYNVMIHVDAEQKNVYFRTKLASSDEWSSKSTSNTGIASNSGAAGFKAYIQPDSSRIDRNRAEVYFDNIRVIQGMYIDELTFTLNDAEITSTADITEAGTVKATYKVMNYDLDFNNEDVAVDTSSITPILAAFDSKGMMLDCQIDIDKEIEIYDNDAETSLDVSGFYDKLDGGTLRFYVWDSITNMEALFDEVVVPATAVTE